MQCINLLLCVSNAQIALYTSGKKSFFTTNSQAFERSINPTNNIVPDSLLLLSFLFVASKYTVKKNSTTDMSNEQKLECKHKDASINEFVTSAEL